MPDSSCCGGQCSPRTRGQVYPLGSVVVSSAAHSDRVSTRGVTKAVSWPALLLSKCLPVALLHTPKQGGKSILPRGKPALPFFANHSSAPVRCAGSHLFFSCHTVFTPALRWLGHAPSTDPETSLLPRASLKVQSPLRVSPGNELRHLLSLVV